MSKYTKQDLKEAYDSGFSNGYREGENASREIWYGEGFKQGFNCAINDKLNGGVFEDEDEDCDCGCWCESKEAIWCNDDDGDDDNIM